MSWAKGATTLADSSSRLLPSSRPAAREGYDTLRIGVLHLQNGMDIYGAVYVIFIPNNY